MWSLVLVICSQLVVGLYRGVMGIARQWTMTGVKVEVTFVLEEEISSSDSALEVIQNLINDLCRVDRAIFHFRVGHEYKATEEKIPNANRRWLRFTTTLPYNYNQVEKWNGKMYAVAIGRIPGFYKYWEEEKC